MPIPILPILAAAVGAGTLGFFIGRETAPCPALVWDGDGDAHQRLIQRIGPDQGGSRYLAAAVDRAKAVLLGQP